MAIAATFMMKLVMIMTKKAIPRIKTTAGASVKSCSQFTASHSAALVCQRQKPMDIAPPKSRMIFQGMSSRSSTFRIFRIKNSSVELRRIAVLSMVFKAGTQFFRAISRMTARVIAKVKISFLFQPPNSVYIRLAFSFKPGITAFSGLQTRSMSPQMRKTISHPTGAM
ncbi:MAG: hypothetical protein ACD_75C01737G0005 [uncultured bacterium]|nr:MAG: hypothetical protein ACD_75C01737G0005 [uncultured bacterium]